MTAQHDAWERRGIVNHHYVEGIAVIAVPRRSHSEHDLRNVRDLKTDSART
jgi:hypothetical protein